MSDYEVIRRCKEGDPTAFRALYDQHVSAALRMAYSVLRDRDLAEDAVQEAFVRAFNAIGSVDPNRPFRPYLNKIVVREALRIMEKHGRVSILEELPELPVSTEDLEVDTRRILWSCIAALPLPLRTLVTLKYYWDLSDPEIAEHVHCPVGTVKSRLSKARQLLREACLAQGVGLSLEED